MPINFFFDCQQNPLVITESAKLQNFNFYFLLSSGSNQK